jgi:predicted house-cleaning noncanonical NTP pyrophosphatase (MazG superfamily)
MKKIYYKKLIRDKIPERIKDSGGTYLCNVLSQKELKNELLKKVEEEAGGVGNANNKKEIVSEMGDVLDVIDEIKKIYKISSKEISDSRKTEYKRKGGFNKRQFLVWAEDTGYKSNERKGK